MTQRARAGAVLALGALCLAACGLLPSRAPEPAPAFAAPGLWNDRPEADAWTAAARAALQGPAAALVASEPADIDAWCPRYGDAGAARREDFWIGLLSALAEYESTWNPGVVGGGGRYFGLMQISPATARFYGCEAGSGEALLNGPANLRCALRIWAITVPRDNAVSAGGGVAADWGPMSREGPREEMRAALRQQPYCRARR